MTGLTKPPVDINGIQYVLFIYCIIVLFTAVWGYFRRVNNSSKKYTIIQVPARNSSFVQQLSILGKVCTQFTEHY